ncbi:MAG: transposase [Chloroflexi bacterium]|nr:transposase [Chloroflexota bacterium]
MHCSTSFGIVPILPRTLALLLLLSLLLQTSGLALISSHLLPPLQMTPARRHQLRRRQRASRRVGLHCYLWPFLRHSAPRLLARWTLLSLLLHTRGWLAFTPLTASVLLIPLVQTVCGLWPLYDPSRAHGLRRARGATELQRLYQLTVVLLFVSTGLQLVSRLPTTPDGLFLPMALTTWVTRPDDDTEISIATTPAKQYTVTLRGAFTLIWEPRDDFERWLLILFLRQLQPRGAARPLLTQRQMAEAFGVCQPDVSLWERHVRAHSWHYLSDRFRHALQSVLPAAAMSQAILQVWVPAFWLSAWDVRERLIQLAVIPNREALDVEALHALAQHTGFNQVRDLLLERFHLQNGQLIARDPWWLKNLLALNERLVAKLEQGERLSPQELIEIEPWRLKTPEKPADSEPAPLAAALKSALFDAPAETPMPTEPVRCTYCDSDQVAPKSKQPRLKTIVDAFGQKHVVEVLRYYCKNLACPYHTFTHLPHGILPHSPYPVQVRVLAVEVYVQLLSTYRRSARVLEVKASTVYHWIASISPAAFCLAAYLGAVRTSGVIGIDDKWVRVCSPSAVRPHGTRPRAVWRYAYFAVDVYSYDLLALELYPEHGDEAVRLFLLELKAKGIRPRVVVSDLDPAYGRMLPLVFPQAVHHECIFHALQNALNQMTQVYGRHYQEKVPATAPLHDAIIHLFQAQSQKTVQKRYAELMQLRSGYVTRTPDIACVFDSLERHFPKLVNAIESADIPRTNNATELVIRRFDQHYQGMGGLDSFQSAQVYLRLFELVYRLTPFMDDNPGHKRGKCPLELAGYDLKQLPIADFFANLKLPALTLAAQSLSP